MSFQDVSTLVNFYERIIAWRRTRRKQKTRIGVQRFRERLQKAGKNRNAGALKKPQEIKKAAAPISAKCHKRKLEENS